MNRLTGDQLAFLDRFARTPDAQSLAVILGAELKAVEQELRTSSGDLLMRAQGKAQQLDWLLQKLSTERQPSRPAPRSVPRPLDANPFDRA
jgi:hypothetical protein